MTDRLWHTLRAEGGQTILMFVIVLTVLVILLAFVVDIGGWLGTQHRLQTVADAAALSAVQSGQTASVDDGWATIAVPNVTPSNVPGLPTAVTVTATHPAPIIFSGVAGIQPFDQTATATAEAAPASTLTNSTLTRVVGAPGGTAPYVTPVVVNQCIFSGPPCLSAPPGFLASDCFISSTGCDLNFDATDRGGSLFGIANISNVVPGNRTFSSWMRCASCAPGTFAANSPSGPLTPGTSGARAVNAMNQTIGKTLIFPVFDSFSGTTYDIVGFSAFVVTTTQFVATSPLNGPPANWQTDSALCTPTCKVIHGYFTNYSLPASSPVGVGSISGSGLQDFGVREIGLTK